MFGGEFGAFRSRGRHCFDEDHPLYRELAAVLTLRRSEPALRRGRQYLRPISGDGVTFDAPHLVGGEMHSVVAWSRILADRELVLAINTDPDESRTAWVTVDDGLHAAGDRLRCRYSTAAADIGQELEVQPRNGKSVLLPVPPGGFVAYAPS